MEVARTTGQQLQKYNPHVPRKDAPKAVLDEDEYVDQLDRIIRRDFFPDLLDPTDADADVPAMSVNKFIANHTSEDNASFHDIVDRANAEIRARTKWIDAKADDERRAGALHERLRLTDDDDIRPKHLDLLHYQPRNALMFPAETRHPIVIVDRGDRISHLNTRLSYDSSSNLSELSTTTSAPSMDGGSTPCIRGYKLVRSPTGGNGHGAIPSHLRHLPAHDDEKSAAASFHVPQLPPRDRIARELGQAASKSIAKRKHDLSVRASPRTPLTSSTPSVELSPAVKRLLAKQQKSSGDSQLRASYSAPDTPMFARPNAITPTSMSTTPALKKKR